MKMKMNLQIVPAPEGSMPATMALCAIPIRGDQVGTEEACPVCDGHGVLPRGESCRRCNGMGHCRIILAARGDVSEQDIPEICSWLDGLDDDPDRRQQVTVRLTEAGGGLTNTGHATIICGLDGTPKTGAAHALFYAHAAMCIYYSHHRGAGSGTVDFVGVDRNARHNLGIVSTRLYEFDDSADYRVVNRKPKLPFPAAAVAAAQAKARCYHCRSAYYTAGGGASGPSGARTGAGAAYGGMPSPEKGPGIGYDPA